MPEQRLDVDELGPSLEEPGRIDVPELMGGDLLVEARAIE